MPSPLSRRHQNNLIDYLKMVWALWMIHTMVWFTAAFLLETSLLIRGPVSCEGPSITAPPHIGTAAFSVCICWCGEPRSCHMTEGCTHPDENDNGRQPPPHQAVCCFIKRACRQTVQSQIDYAAPLHWLCRLLLSLQVCATKKYTQSETQQQKIPKLWFLLIFILSMKSSRIVFFFFIINSVDYLLIMH